MTAPPAFRDLRVDDARCLIDIRREVSAAAARLGFGLVDRTKLITATSELSRNILDHAGSGRVRLETLDGNLRSGVRLSFEDQGPGIADVDLAMQDGYTSAKGMGLGLPGARRLVHEFSIASEPGRGTRIVITMWKR